jgi:hypothetical protein
MSRLYGKVDVSQSNIAIMWAPIIQVVCGKVWIQEQTPNNMCLKEIGIRAQNMLTILSSIVNMIEGAYLTTQ